MALEPDDVEASESPLLLAVARQLTHGPGELYGPFGERNPLVLIHPPLYYRLAASSAWPLARAGIRPEKAALVAGRTISLIGWGATLAGAFFLARFQAAPRIAGWWAILLAAATPVYGGLIVEVRPDMLGIALQTWGVVLFLGALQNKNTSDRLIMLAFVFFALAACVKQHLIVAAAVSMVLLVAACARRRVRFKVLAGAFLIDTLILFSYFGLEEWLTKGHMSKAVIVAARACSVFHPATWQFARDSMLVLSWKCVGLILLLATAALAGVVARSGVWSRLLAASGIALIGLVSTLTVIQSFAVSPQVSRAIVLGLVVTMVFLLPTSVHALRRAWRSGGVDIALTLYVFAELALTAYLWRLSTGGWFNYAIEAVVLISILTARAMARVVEHPLPKPAILGFLLAVLAVPAFALTDVKEIIARRRAESFLIEKLVDRLDASPGAVFFVDRPGFNRVYGRAELVHDPWLYPVFESIQLAEPRSAWLERALETGPVRTVVASSLASRIDGLSRSLPELGYTLRGRVGPWLVWVRQQ